MGQNELKESIWIWPFSIRSTGLTSLVPCPYTDTKMFLPYIVTSFWQLLVVQENFTNQHCTVTDAIYMTQIKCTSLLDSALDFGIWGQKNQIGGKVKSCRDDQGTGLYMDRLEKVPTWRKKFEWSFNQSQIDLIIDGRVEEYWVPSIISHNRRMHKIQVWKHRISVGV